MKLTFSTFLIVLLVFSAPCLSQSAGFIRISVSAPGDKPYPTIIFYSVEMLDTTFENPFVHRFEVNNSLLLKLKEVILGTELPSDDEMIDPSIIFRMSIGVTDTILNVGFRTSAYKIFTKMISAYTLENKQSLLTVVNQMALRLRIPTIKAD